MGLVSSSAMMRLAALAALVVGATSFNSAGRATRHSRSSVSMVMSPPSAGTVGIVMPTDAPATFHKDIKTPDPVPEAGIERAVEIMKEGRMYRYNVPDAYSEVSLAEQEFAAYTGHKYAVGLNSCGSAIFLGLKCAGMKAGDKVLCNGLSFNAVPSAVEHAGGEPVYVEADDMFLMDLADLEAKIAEHPGIKYLLVTHMRGKVLDMDRMWEIAQKHDLIVVEDCAHALGVQFKGKQAGHWCSVAAYSTQSYKMINSGEGGFLCTDDDELAAKAFCYAGCYEGLYKKHLASPPHEVFEKVKKATPNYSLRMHSLTAATIRPQIANLEDRIETYNRRYYPLQAALNAGSPYIRVPDQLPEVRIVGDSMQFLLSGLTASQVQEFLALCAERGIELGLFGSADNARNYRNWQFSDGCKSDLPVTEDIIAVTCDMRLPLQFEDEDVVQMGKVVLGAMHDLMGQ